MKEFVFVGAYAVVAHTGVHRTTRDLDLAPIFEDHLAELGYVVRDEGGESVVRTSEGVGVDIFRKDVSGIPVAEVIETTMERSIEKDVVHVLALEALLIAKMRAARTSTSP